MRVRQAGFASGHADFKAGNALIWRPSLGESHGTIVANSLTDQTRHSGSPQGLRAFNPRRMTSCRLARLVGVVALAAIASSCLPIGRASTSTIASITAEDGLGNDPGATSAIVGVAAGTRRGVASASGDELSIGRQAGRSVVEPARDCSPQGSGDIRAAYDSPAAASIESSRAVYGCAYEVGLAPASSPAAVNTLMSGGIDGPLLLAGDRIDPALMAELERLAPERIIAAGFDPELLRYALAEFHFELIAVDQQAASSPATMASDRVWLVADDEWATPWMALGHQSGAGVVVAAGDLRALPAQEREMIFTASQVEVFPDVGDDAGWQLEVIRRGHQIPGGGLLLFDADSHRRIVAMYGHPSTSALGVLGEQGPEEGVERLRSISEGYGADGSRVLPAFEIIATVASAGPGGDGDYSAMTARDVIRPWIETAAANDIYVVLDLQPGRSDLLSQAKVYEEFLRLPHVGLALDPEWRLKPHQVHLEQIGTVDGAEINQVVEWLAGLVRQHALPQKLLIVHQFASSMITNRSYIDTPPELAVLIHMDGQGSMQGKQNTWNRLTNQPDAGQFYWGWKNFYDEDSPIATPEQVIELSPNPVFVSFQ